MGLTQLGHDDGAGSRAAGGLAPDTWELIAPGGAEGTQGPGLPSIDLSIAASRCLHAEVLAKVLLEENI